MNNAFVIVNVSLMLLTGCSGSDKTSSAEPPGFISPEDTAAEPEDTAADSEDTAPPEVEANDISSLLESIRAEYDLPALAALRLEGDTVTDHGVTGMRKLGDETLATLNDKWHLGSCTKAMTATLVGVHIDDGLLEWTTTMQDVFPDLTGMHDDFRTVTIEMLLSHTGRVDDTSANRDAIDTQTTDDTQWRRDLTRAILLGEPGVSSGTYRYSNYGYVMVGSILEHLTGTSWEALMQERLFAPLGMTGCGFGLPDAAGDVSQPWGHSGSEPVNSDNPSMLGPAGTVHCPLMDWSLFIGDQMSAYRGDESLLSAAQAEQMFTVQSDNYAMGWLVVSAPALGGPIFSHRGSNTLNLAEVVASPDINRAYLVTTNRASEADSQAMVDTLFELHELDG